MIIATGFNSYSQHKVKKDCKKDLGNIIYILISHIQRKIYIYFYFSIQKIVII